MKTTKLGFSAVEIVLVLVIVVVIGFIGYTVAQNTIFKTDAALENVNMSETANDVPAVPEIQQDSDLSEITETIDSINLDDDSGDISELEKQLSDF